MKVSIIVLVFVFLFGCVKKDSGELVKNKHEEVFSFEQALKTMDMVELGKTLYFDPRLSHDGTISCNSCHNVMAYGSDNRSVSMGVRGQRGGRNAPTVFNAKFLSVQFWDGRAKDLVEQAKGPIINPVEMGVSEHDVVIERLRKIDGYVRAFQKVFGSKDAFNIDNVAKAIASYEEKLVTLNSPFDRFKAGEEDALSPEAKKGWQTFQQVGCVTCHSGDHFAGPDLPVGQGFFMKFPTFEDNKYVKKYNFKKDLGRYEATKQVHDKHMWRVPTLRNIAMTAPYFHNGAVLELEEAIRVMGKVQLNQELNDEQVMSIAAFLKSLTGFIPKQTMPVLPPTPGEVVTEVK